MNIAKTPTSCRRRATRIAVSLAFLCAASVALAQPKGPMQPPPWVGKQPRTKEEFDSLVMAVRATREAHAKEIAEARKRNPPRSVAKTPATTTAKLAGRAFRATLGHILLERPVNAKEAKFLAGVGFKTAPSQEKVEHKTIFAGRSYVRFDIEAGRDLKDPERFVGKEVELDVRYTRGEPLVTDVRLK